MKRQHNKLDLLAQGLGWFSIGLGLAEVLLPRTLGRTLGMSRNQTKLLRPYGMREIAAGVGILFSKNRAPWVWSRVAGDGLDLATLSAGLTKRSRRLNTVIGLGAVAGVTLLDIACAQALSKKNRKLSHYQYDYSSRSGLGGTPEAMRGAAKDFEVPRDMRIPDALRPRLNG